MPDLWARPTASDRFIEPSGPVRRRRRCNFPPKWLLFARRERSLSTHEQHERFARSVGCARGLHSSFERRSSPLSPHRRHHHRPNLSSADTRVGCFPSHNYMGLTWASRIEWALLACWRIESCEHALVGEAKRSSRRVEQPHHSVYIDSTVEFVCRDVPSGRRSARTNIYGRRRLHHLFHYFS